MKCLTTQKHKHSLISGSLLKNLLLMPTYILLELIVELITTKYLSPLDKFLTTPSSDRLPIHLSNKKHALSSVLIKYSRKMSETVKLMVLVGFTHIYAFVLVLYFAMVPKSNQNLCISSTCIRAQDSVVMSKNRRIPHHVLCFHLFYMILHPNQHQ